MKEERKKQIVQLKSILQDVLELKKLEESKTGMEEFIREFGLEGCLVPSEYTEISDLAVRKLNARIDEDVRQNEVFNDLGVSKLIKGPSIY